MAADRLNGPPGNLGELARRQPTAALQKQHQLIDYRVSQQSAHPGFPVLDLVHRRRSTGKPTPCQAMLRRFENSRNVEMSIWLAVRLSLFWIRDSELATDLSGQQIGDLRVACYCGNAARVG